MLSKNPGLSTADIRSIMRGTADKIGGNNGATAYVSNGQGTFNQYYGYGRVNALAALNATPPPGDYNDNGTVDAPDYAVWRNYLNQSVLMTNDITPGMVTQSDYDVWRAHFGQTSTSSTGSGAFVPGDYDQDGTVDDADYAVWETDFGSTTALAADGNFNGVVDTADLAVWQEMRGVTTLEVIPGDFNLDGVVDMADHELWEAEDPLADADLDSDVDNDDLAIWTDHWGLTNAGVYPATLVGEPPLRVAGAAPQVIGVRLGGSNSTHDDFDFTGVDGSGEQLRTVPVGGLDTIYIQFGEEVLVTQGALTLTGLNYASVPAVIDFTYDLETQTAMWQFDDPLIRDQYLIRLSDSVFDLDHDALDGEFTNPWSLGESSGYASTFPSGNGEAGGEFRFRFTNFSGDFSRNNQADSGDGVIWAINNTITSGATQPNGDADGDGDVDTTDRGYYLAAFGTDWTQWPSVEPGLILVSTATDENDANYTLGDLSLQEALVLAAANAGVDTIVFQPAISEILLGSALTINSDVTIAGAGVDELTIDAQGNSRVFVVDGGKTATMNGLTITGGGNVSQGGGVYVNGDLTLVSAAVVDNAATSQGGGAYVSTTGSLTVLESTIDGNSASAGGGIFGHFGAGERLHIAASTISNNVATGSGGGLVFFGWGATDSIGTIVNSTISGNTAAWSGGVRVRYAGANLTIVNSTIANNTASTGAGVEALNGPTITLHNTIVADNKTSGGAASNVGGTLHASSAYNLIGLGGSGGLVHGTNGNIVLTSGQSAGLTTLGDYGGPTRTHALLSTSPAIDAGDNAIAAAFDLFGDQRDESRIDDGDDDTFAHIDIGAFELGADEYFDEV